MTEPVKQNMFQVSFKIVIKFVKVDSEGSYSLTRIKQMFAFDKSHAPPVDFLRGPFRYEVLIKMSPLDIVTKFYF